MSTRTDRSTGRTGRPAPIALAAALVALVGVLAGLGGGPAGAAPAQLPGIGDTIPAPITTLSPDGLSATDGVRTLTVSQATDLDPAGQVITVSGAGYDDFKGVYIAFCVVPPTDQLPSPCGGGIDMEGTTGSSHWISSNAPPYGAGLAVPYGPGGTFETTLKVAPEVGNTDCRRVRCAVVTRNDHVRSTDRSQDIFVPVSFAAASPDGAAVPDTAPPATAPPETTTTAAPETTTTVAPETTTTTMAPTTTATPPDDVALASTSSDASSGGSATPWIIVGAAVLIAAVAAAVVLQRRRSQGPAA
jgi:MYXO-CTERM domain-containing protein